MQADGAIHIAIQQGAQLTFRQCISHRNVEVMSLYLKHPLFGGCF